MGLFFPFYHDVRVSFHGTCFIIGRSRLQNQITLRLFVVHSALLLSSVLSLISSRCARILEEFHLIHLDLSPTTDSRLPSPFHQRTIFRRTNYSFPLPLLDREVVTSFTIAALHHQCILLHRLAEQLDLLSNLWLSILLLASQERLAHDFPTSHIKWLLLLIQRELWFQPSYHNVICLVGGRSFVVIRSTIATHSFI